MSDTTTIWDAVNNRGDWVLKGGILQTGNDLITAALISAFTDRQAAPDDVIPDGSGDRRGWWGDPTMGSRVWLLERRKQDQQALNDGRSYLIEAYQWMIDDGAAARVDILTEWTRAGMFGAQQQFYQQDGTVIPLNFAWAWKQLNLAA